MTKYVIDASSLNELEDQYPKNIPVFSPIYDKVYEMFENGDLFSVITTYEAKSSRRIGENEYR